MDNCQRTGPRPLGLTQQDLHLLTISHVRYSLGRTSGIAEDACQWVRRVWPHLRGDVRSVLIWDVELQGRQRYGDLDPYGLPCDRAAWLALLDWMREHQGDPVEPQY